MDVIPDIQSSGFEGQYNYFINNNSFVENWISVSPLKQHWIYCQKIHNTTSQKKKKSCPIHLYSTYQPNTT
jgi:hypothetical protein